MKFRAYLAKYITVEIETESFALAEAQYKALHPDMILDVPIILIHENDEYTEADAIESGLIPPGASK